jgi:hypothetical protein
VKIKMDEILFVDRANRAATTVRGCGPTNAANLIRTCERHHYAVHEAGWEIVREPDGTAIWTSPAGHAYRVPPATYPIDATMKIKKHATTQDERKVEDGGSNADPP